MTQRTRRRFLAVAGALGVGAMAGCLSGDDSEPDDTSDDDADDTTADGSGDGTDDGTDESSTDSESDGDETSVDGTVLGDISVDNLHDGSHTVDIQVELGGSMEAWVSKDVDGRTGNVSLERTWSEAEGDFNVRIRLDGEEFVEVTPDDWNDPDCISLIVVIDSSGSLRISGDTTSGFCTE